MNKHLLFILLGFGSFGVVGDEIKPECKANAKSKMDMLQKNYRRVKNNFVIGDTYFEETGIVIRYLDNSKAFGGFGQLRSMVFKFDDSSFCGEVTEYYLDGEFVKKP